MIIVGGGSGPTLGGSGQYVRWTVELDADPDTSGQFMVGTSVLGGTDSVAPDERWIAIPTLRVKSAAVRRGGGQANRAYDAGECVVVLDNSSGDFDPDNNGSFYVMGPRQLVTQGTGLRVSASPGASTPAAYDAAVAALGAVNYWKCQETSGTTLVDSIGGVSLTITGTGTTLAQPALAPGLGTSVAFSGSSSAAAASIGSTVSAPFSVEAWIGTTGPSGTRPYFGTRAPSDNGFDAQVTASAAGLHADIGDGSSWLTTAADAASAVPSVAHVVYSVSTTGYTVYLNGSPVASGSLAGTGLLYNSTHRPVIAGNGTADPPFIGNISNVALYPTALTGAQVSAQYDLGLGISSRVTLFTGKLGTDGVALGGHWAAPTATLTATDMLDALAGVDVPAQGGQTGSGESSSVRAHWLLDQAGIPASKRSIQAAGRQCLGTTGGGTVRGALDQVANGEAGRFFVDRAGVVTMTWHDAEYGKTPQITYANTGDTPKYESIEASTGAAGVTNTATVKRIVPRVRNEDTGQFEDGPDLPDAGATDWESVAMYGTRSVAVDVVLQNDGDVEALAGFLAHRRSTPIPRITTLVSVPLEAMTGDQAQAVLEAELGDLITLTQRTIDGRVREWAATIENIAFDHSSPMTTVQFSTAPSDTAAYDAAGWFLIGSSLLGGADVLAPF